MAYILDIIYSMLLGGVILVIILNANNLSVHAQAEYQGNQSVQHMLVTTTTLIESEFRNMGVNVPDMMTPILYAGADSIVFLEDYNADNTIDTLRYWLGRPKEMYFVQNDSIRLIHRQVNSASVMSVGLCTQFKLRYFTQHATDTLAPPVGVSDRGAIQMVEMTLEVQNPYAIYRNANEVKTGQREAYYSSSMWRQTRLASQNLRR